MNVTLSDESDFEDSDDSDSPDEEGITKLPLLLLGAAMSLVCMSHLTLFIHLRMILKMLMACKKPTTSFLKSAQSLRNY